MGGANVSTTVENRVADPVRNLKNYCIILNTLARKAAQHAAYTPSTWTIFHEPMQNASKGCPTQGPYSR